MSHKIKVFICTVLTTTQTLSPFFYFFCTVHIALGVVHVDVWGSFCPSCDLLYIRSPRDNPRLFIQWDVLILGVLLKRGFFTYLRL